MVAKNDITGDEIKSKSSTSDYEDGWDRIFGKKDKNYTDGFPNDKQFKESTVPEKINDRMNHLQKLMEGNNHLERPEYVLDVIDSVGKFFSAMNDEDKEYLQIARSAVEQGLEWNISQNNKTIVNEDDGYLD